MAHRQDALWSPEKDRGIFFWLFLFGAAFILALKEWVGDQLLATAIPGCLMLCYAYMVWDFGKKRPRADSSGDNLYYLGFLYTLTSLGHSLFRFSVEGENAAIIVTNFGIAISTTILGMALRVLLGRPGGDDPASIEASARRDLASAARSLRDEMDYTVQEFIDFRKRARESLEQTFSEALSGISTTFGRVRTVQEVIEKFEKDMREVTGALAHQARTLGQSASDVTEFRQSMTELQAGIGGTVGVLKRHTDALDEGAAAASDALHAQAERIAEADFLQSLVNHAGAAVATEIGATTDRFSMLLDRLQEGDKRRDQALAASQKAMTELQEVLEASRRLAEASIGGMNASRDAAARLEAATEGIAGFNDSVREMAHKIAAASDGMVAGLESTVHQVSRFNDSAHEIARALAASSGDTVLFRDNVRTAGDELARATATLTDWARNVEEAPRPRPAGGGWRWLAPWRWGG